MIRFIFSALIALSFSASALAQTGKDDVVDFGEPQPLKIVTEDGEYTFLVEEAKTLDQQARGMMWRDSMESDAGMIFEFAEPKVATIWMKNTSIPFCLLYTSPSPRDGLLSRMPSSA